ncbi:radical SAM protein [Rhodohalobacter sulfatireducens]|uniref:Elp3/MiaA/NifB-like radical SAM core domain-containing protein n=1 Tax=Rhodohalobacter sulfatireducens TaxID=2911366 RepID=A0ABS9KCX3_9BACT|nr:hypothetical protein [Rhodohalobacter sulfatireducens]MCG2588704.1 hypothetical protein [Rhodohalobacter sulfatireducens]
MIHEISNRTVEKYRPSKVRVDPEKPYMYLHEQEMQKDGSVKDVNTVFLTNRECPFKCVMCDLWRHTLDDPTPAGAIPAQIEYAMERLPSAKVIKLYNSGNFFDGKAIPRSEYEQIAELLSDYEHVIVENHPKLIGSFILEFRDLLSGSLEIAMGLETIHPDVLPKLNKQITKEDFFEATHFLVNNEIDVRSFILLNPPFLTDPLKNIEWTLRSVEFAFDSGCTACSVIPVRDGNGIMEELKKTGEYTPPTILALESVFTDALKMNRGRVFCDLWDLERFSECDKCFNERKRRLDEMNLTQKILPEIECECNPPTAHI